MLACPLVLVLEPVLYYVLDDKFEAFGELHVSANTLMCRLAYSGL